MDLVEGSAAAPKKRGRPPKSRVSGDFSLSLDRASSSSAGNSAPPTPAAQSSEDPLAAAELATLGVIAAGESLPPPPRDGASGGAAGGAGAKRTIDMAMSAASNGRAKRPKNVKADLIKANKALVRRSVVSATGQPNGKMNAEGVWVMHPNNDFCDSCGGKGHFLCCDGGCLRSFHFVCLEPPMMMDEVTDESWFCPSCTAADNPVPPPPVPFFSEFIRKIDMENPKAFSLTSDIKAFYKNVATGTTGEFIDSKEHRPPSKITGRAVGQEDRDGYRLKDRIGRTILCYKCCQAASLPKQRRIISCDFCEQHWHLDCLDPPMTGMPPGTRKWMCPVHSDHVLPKTRQPKQTSTIVVEQPALPNNGDIIIIPRRAPPRPIDEFEEITVNRIRYQVPEETIILDFWGRLQDSRHRAAVSELDNKYLQVPAIAGSREGSPNILESPLTSLGDISDGDPPSVIKARTQPPLRRRREAVPFKPDTSALDHLAMLADGYYEQYRVEKLPVLEVPTKPRLILKLGDDPSAPAAIAASDKGKGRALPKPIAETSLLPRQPQMASSSSAQLPRTLDSAGRAASTSKKQGKRSPTPPAEFAVTSKDDLKALMHVRKMLTGATGASVDPSTRAALVGFIEGNPIMPNLTYSAGEHSSPWNLPWESDAKEGTYNSKPSAARPLPPWSKGKYDQAKDTYDQAKVTLPISTQGPMWDETTVTRTIYGAIKPVQSSSARPSAASSRAKSSSPDTYFYQPPTKPLSNLPKSGSTVPSLASPKPAAKATPTVEGDTASDESDTEIVLPQPPPRATQGRLTPMSVEGDTGSEGYDEEYIIPNPYQSHLDKLELAASNPCDAPWVTKNRSKPALASSMPAAEATPTVEDNVGSDDSDTHIFPEPPPVRSGWSSTYYIPTTRDLEKRGLM